MRIIVVEGHTLFAGINETNVVLSQFTWSTGTPMKAAGTESNVDPVYVIFFDFSATTDVNRKPFSAVVESF